MRMDIPFADLRTELLRAFHQGIKDALAYDKKVGQDAPEYYGVREYPDWRECIEQIEAALDEREVEYEKIELS